MPTQPQKLNFPTLHRIVLRRFSLFSSAPEVDETLQDGVFCLAGANGLDKSTFLSAANFAITGLVPDPSKRFQSVEEYYSEGLEFGREYFKGRISERDRKGAEVAVELTVGAHTYELTRGIFEADELRSLTIRNGTSTIVDGDELSASDRHERFADQLTSDVGLAAFEQLVFIQHFVLTFDERRHLLFWDPRVLEQALFLAFGVDRAAAKKADTLRREADRADSLARNAKWQATETKKKLKDLEATAEELASDNESDLLGEHEKLTKASERAEGAVERVEGHQRDLSLRLASLSSKQVTLRSQYEKEFSQRIRTTTHVAHHPLVAASIDEADCGLCGARGATVVDAIRAKVQLDACALCGSKVEKARARPKDIARLRELDEAIATNKTDLDEVVKGLERIDKELVAAREGRAAAGEALRTFEKQNYSFLVRATADQSGSVQAVAETYKRQMQEHLDAKDRHRQRRDEKKRELRKLQDALEQRYAAVEDEFVPMFKDLAFQFLGLELDIRMETAGAPGATLVLDVKNAARREHHQLSESQRFFVDIALRMALAQFMSSANGKATLFVDTPEGSLDIAYENRAGNMLASFVQRGFHIVMTANINTSRLLQALAQKLGREKMQLCRMTSWTELSEVQEEEEDLFEKAYSAIEAALGAAKKGRNK